MLIGRGSLHKDLEIWRGPHLLSTRGALPSSEVTGEADGTRERSNPGEPVGISIIRHLAPIKMRDSGSSDINKSLEYLNSCSIRWIMLRMRDIPQSVLDWDLLWWVLPSASHWYQRCWLLWRYQSSMSRLWHYLKSLGHLSRNQRQHRMVCWYSPSGSRVFIESLLMHLCLGGTENGFGTKVWLLLQLFKGFGISEDFLVSDASAVPVWDLKLFWSRLFIS